MKREHDIRPPGDARFAVTTLRLTAGGRVKHYAIKQVAPVIKDEGDEIIVITVYTFYF